MSKRNTKKMKKEMKQEKEDSKEDFARHTRWIWDFCLNEAKNKEV